MRNLLKFLILLNGIISILPLCTDRPTIPSSSIPKTSPLVITPQSSGMSNFPESTRQLSITMTVTPNEACASGSLFNLFTLSVTPAGNTEKVVARLFVDCSNLNLMQGGDWRPFTYGKVFTGAIGPISVFVSINLESNSMKAEYQTGTSVDGLNEKSTVAQTWSFDATTKIYLCSSKASALPISCTISNLEFDYQYFGSNAYEIGHSQGTKPILTALYPLMQGPATSLTSTIGSPGSGYFGDSASSPTANTSPTWDSSNKFVKIATGQFLTFPLPSLLPGTVTTSYAFAVAAWIRVTQIPVASATIFSMHTANGIQDAYKLCVLQSSKRLSLSIGSEEVITLGTVPVITLNTWQLVGFTGAVSSDKRSTVGTLFVEDSAANFNIIKQYEEMSAASTLLRIGGSADGFVGDVAFVRMITSGGGYIKTTSTCSSANAIELGSNSFSLSCTASAGLDLTDNQCKTSCPGGQRPMPPFSGAPTNLCLASSDHCSTYDSTGCFTCHTNYLLYQKGCIDTCPAKTYTTATTCEDCSVNCKTCDSTGCSVCDTNYLLYQKDCVDKCPAKTYTTATTCEDCSVNCKTCDSAGCSVCDTNYILYQKACYDVCPTKTYYTGSTCQNCPSNCKTCDSTECSVCDKNYILYQKACLSQCPTKMYFTGSTCQSCSANCKTCDSTQCLTCDANYLLHKKACVDSCPALTYSTGSTCQSCPSHCKTCDSTGCLTCNANYFLYEEACVDSCPTRKYLKETSCLECSDHCAECDTNGCKVCDTAYQLDKTTKKCVALAGTEAIKSGLSGGAIAGIICASVGLLFGGAWVLCILMRRKKNNYRLKNSQQIHPETQSPNHTNIISSPHNQTVPISAGEMTKLVP